MSRSNFDVVVIGAGIAGASVAAHLAASRSVALLEAETHPGYHSTGRSAALFSAMYGSQTVRALSRGSREFFHRPPADFADAPLVKPRGALYIATPAQQAAIDSFAELPDVAAVTQRLSAAETLETCPILRPERVAQGVMEPDASDIDVDALHQGYLRQLRNRGGELFTEHPVDGLMRKTGRWVAKSGERLFAAPIVVNAAGAWADAIATMARISPLGLEPRRRTALLVDAPAGHAIDSWPLVIDIDEQFYFKPDAGRLLLSPADETLVEPCDVQPDEWDIAVAIDRVQEAAMLDVRQIRGRWAGLRTFAPDRSPVAGFDRNTQGFFWLAGQGGYGIQTAPALSRVAASLILGEQVPADLAAFGIDETALSPGRLEDARVA